MKYLLPILLLCSCSPYKWDKADIALGTGYIIASAADAHYSKEVIDEGGTEKNVIMGEDGKYIIPVKLFFGGIVLWVADWCPPKMRKWILGIVGGAQTAIAIDSHNKAQER